MKSTQLFVLAALSAVFAEAALEHGTELEDTLIGGIESLNVHEKFVTFEAVLGKPALHDELEDSKCRLSICLAKSLSEDISLLSKSSYHHLEGFTAIMHMHNRILASFISTLTECSNRLILSV